MGHGECVELIQKEVEKRPNFLEMYLATAVARGEFQSIRDVSNCLFLIEK